MCKRPSKQKGFTLIELMMVVVIVGILAAVAFPMYTEQVRNTRRADAAAALVGLANAMVRHSTNNNGSYCDAGGTGGTNSCGASQNDTGAPSIFSDQVPLDGGTAYYNLRISAVTATSYDLSAVPVGGQASDDCGTLTLDEVGVKGVGGGTMEECWR